MLGVKHARAMMLPGPATDALHCAALQEWSVFAQTKTARHKLAKFLKDHGHLLEPDSAQSDSSSAAAAASNNGASSATFSDIQVTGSEVVTERLLPPASASVLQMLSSATLPS